MGTWPNSLLGLLGLLWSSPWRSPFTMMKAYEGTSVFSASFTLLSLVAFSNSILFFLFLSVHIILNIKKTPSQPCLMQFEVRPAHFIKHYKTLSGTRVFMCNQMQQLAWLQLLLGLLHRSTWLDFSSAANSRGAFSLAVWRGLGEIMYLVLSATTCRRERNCWVGKPGEFPAPLPAHTNTGNCFLALPSISPWFWRTLCQAPPPWLLWTVVQCLCSAIPLSPRRGGGALPDREGPSPDSIPLCGWAAGSSAQLNGEASRGGSVVASGSSQGCR